MRATGTAAALLAALAAAAPAGAQDDSAVSRTALERRIAAQPGATVGLYYRSLVAPDSMAIGADIRFHAASTMKVAVMIQAFRDIDSARLRLDERLPVVNAFRSIADGSTYELDRADDSDSSLYALVGRTAPVRQLVELMITISSNLATNVLIERVGAARVQATLRELGTDSMVVLRGVEDGAAYRAGLNNTTTARDLAILLEAIADGRAASAASCGRMLQILLHQRINDAIPRGLPRRTPVAHKTGGLTGQYHDAAIVYTRRRPQYVLVVLTRGIAQHEAATQLIADLAGIIHRWHSVVFPPRD
ncbi:MAG: hypothetical protein A2083_09810 [Gemmatimonadetes bacterium GWC2_71_9]|nr:MAG: hypothetical protein A2083_09810 [Gemmatimonadetes bacterium GWC2_71_9]